MPPFLRLVPLPKSLTSDLPKPITAGIGLAASLPGIAVRTALALPAHVLGTSARIVGRYEELAELGTALVGGRRDRDDVDEFADYPDIQGWGDSTADVERRLRAVEDEPDLTAAADAELAAAADGAPLEAAATTTSEPSTSEPTGEPVHEPAIEMPAELAAAAADREVEPAPATVPDRRELPIADYPSLSAAALRAQVGGLSVDQLTELRTYEQAHAKRLTVLQLLERTIAKKS